MLQTSKKQGITGKNVSSKSYCVFKEIRREGMKILKNVPFTIIWKYHEDFCHSNTHIL